MSEGENFLIVGMSDSNWKEYSSWFGPRGQDAPTRPPDSILVAGAPKGSPVIVLLAGVGIYPTAGPYAVVERVATNPKVPLRIRYEAMLFGAKLLRDYGAMHNKIMLCFPSERSIARILAQVGFEVPAIYTMRWKPIG